MKRKKYAEELETRLSDEEVKVIVKAKKTNTAASREPSLQLFVVSNSAYNSVGNTFNFSCFSYNINGKIQLQCINWNQ